MLKGSNGMNKEMFTFELLDKYPPEVVIRNVLEQIRVATNGYVIGNIEQYDGPIFSYNKRSGLSSLQIALESTAVDIQADLGAQGTEDYKFEVFLTVKGLEHYRYRMMFVGYGTVAYPATIVMNEALAVEYSGRRNFIFNVDSMQDLENMLDTIINSETMVSLIQSLINESLRQKAIMEQQ